MTRSIVIGVTCLASLPLLAQQANSYLPLAVGNKWVLRNTGDREPVVFEVIRRETDGFVIRSTTPWGSTRWTLSDDGGKFYMTGYGNGPTGPMMPLPAGPVYLDFNRAPGDKWSNALGSVTMISKSAVVETPDRTWSDCVQIEHKSKSSKLVSTFAQGVGYVQFGEGNGAYTLDVSSSTLPSAGGSTEPSAPGLRQREKPSDGPSPAAARPSHRGVFFGLTPNRFANEPLTEAVMVNRLQQTVDAGVTYLSGTAKWAELEPSPGEFALDSVSTFLAAAARFNLPVSYTVRVIDTIARDVPDDLKKTKWDDPKMQARALSLIEAIAPLLRDHVGWLSIGYESDSYLAKRPAEINGFTVLHAAIRERVRELLPGIRFSSTFMFSGLGSLTGELKKLNSQLDFLSLTYCPLRPDFTVMDPSVVPADFARMKQVAAGRKIILQEIGYPTAPVTGGSEEKQAEFYRLAFTEISRAPAAFNAVNFMNLADLSRDTVRQFTDYYQLHTPAFEGVLQTMGLFNEEGEPKKAWAVLQTLLKRGI